MRNLKLAFVVVIMTLCGFSPGVVWPQQPAPSGSTTPAPANAAPSNPSPEKNSQKPVADTGKDKDAGKPAEPPAGTGGDVQILSDTMGVNFRPYVQRVIYSVRNRWLQLMPESARPPVMKSGTVIMEFSILKDGKVAGLKTAKSSGDIDLDRAPSSAIEKSAPFAPLPAEFAGQYLTLRAKFHYNLPNAPPDRVPYKQTAPPVTSAPPMNH
jgi:TonB family protein